MKIIFLHIPRTGGLSFRVIMDNVFGEQNIGRCWWVNYYGKALTEADLKHSAYYGHVMFGIHTALPKGAKYITMLRDPAERLLSEYKRNFYRKHLGLTPAELAEEQTKRVVGNDIQVQTVCPTSVGDNLQVRMLAGVPFGVPVSELHVNIALKHLRDHFIHVGRTDRYDDTVCFLREELDWQFEMVPHEHLGPGGEVSDEEKEELKNSPYLRFDYILWNEVRN